MERERKTCSNRPWVRLKPKPATQETLARLVPPAPAPAPVPSRFIPQTLGCVLCRPSWGNWAAVGVFWQDSNAGLRVVQAEQGFFLQHQVRYVRVYTVNEGWGFQGSRGKVQGWAGKHLLTLFFNQSVLTTTLSPEIHAVPHSHTSCIQAGSRETGGRTTISKPSRSSRERSTRKEPGLH